MNDVVVVSCVVVKNVDGEEDDAVVVDDDENVVDDDGNAVDGDGDDGDGDGDEDGDAPLINVERDSLLSRGSIIDSYYLKNFLLQ